MAEKDDEWEQLRSVTMQNARSVLLARQRAEETLKKQSEWLRITLASIGDAVISTDADGRITLMNSVAETLTGWTQVETLGKPLSAVFNIVNEATRKPVENPAQRALEEGVIVGLANHTILISKDGSEHYIDDSASPIRDESGKVVGAILVFRDISEKKQAEQEARRASEKAVEILRQSEERFRQLADAMPQIVWTARADGINDYYNRRWYEFTGLPDDAGEEAWKSILHPKDQPFSIQKWSDSISSGMPFEMELRLLDHKNGCYRWHLARSIPIRDESGKVARWYGTSTDIDSQKRAGDAAHFLAEASSALAAQVDYELSLQKVVKLAVPYFADWAAVDVLNADGSLKRLAVSHQDPAKIELVQELMRRYPPRRDGSSGLDRVLQTGRSEMVANITDDLLVKGAKDEEHLRLIRLLGLKSYLCVPLIVSGKTMGGLTFATAESDIGFTNTDLSMAEDLARRAAMAIENAQLYRALKEADRKKDEFLAVLAHELRNPLAPLSNALQILRMTSINPKVDQVREMMERQVRQMTRLVDDLLDVSRITNGKIALRKERLDLAEVILTALETNRPMIEAANHELTITPSPKPLQIEGDRTRLAQVFSNLLTNSCKYTPEGGRIWLTVENRDSEAVIRVRDNGLGIPAEMLPKIFEMFTQVDRNLGRSQGGLGIGLMLVRSLVQMHGGRVEAKSGGPDRGSEFIVRLPLIPDEPKHWAEDANDAEPQFTKVGNRRRILVVDDNADSSESLAMMLSLSGNEVLTAQDGPSALIAAASFMPDVIFLDIGLPGMNGYEVARRLRLIPSLGQVVLIAQTGWGQEEDRRLSGQAGFDHHFTKPIDPNALMTLLDKLERKPIPSDT